MTRQPYQAKLVILFLSSALVFLALRLWNLYDYSYFIYDQGRDAVKWSEIAQGELTLVGPTSGLAGFFIGPLWYYIGLPGFILTQGHPLGIAVWFILLSTLALPGFWWLTWKLFWNDEEHRQSAFFLLLGGICLSLFIFLPASITSSTTIWNPLIAAPLMMGALFSFWQVRADQKRSRLWLWLGSLCAALTLQSEFAYAVFFLPVIFLVIPWMTKRRSVLDFIVAGFAVALTLVPQGVFELRNQSIMMKSLFGALTDSSKSISWAQHLQQRPMQLLDVTVDFFNGPDQNTWLSRVIVLLLCVIGFVSLAKIWRKNETDEDPSHQSYLRKLLILFALIPYPFFLIWRGNNGNFFWYYMTSHFVFMIPVFVLGLEQLTKKLWKQQPWGTATAGLLIASALVPFVIASVRHWNDSIGHPINETGYAIMLSGVKSAYQLQNQENTATFIITPNIHSQHYDYLFHWYGTKHQLQVPRTVSQPEDKQLILVTEQWGPELSDYVKARRKELTKDWKKQRTIVNGKVIVEEWVK
jgi:hypothetical protein